MGQSKADVTRKPTGMSIANDLTLKPRILEHDMQLFTFYGTKLKRPDSFSHVMWAGSLFKII